MSILVYVHIGKALPQYIYDSLYQTLLVSPNCKIYVIIDDVLIKIFNDTIHKFSLSSRNIQPIPISVLVNGDNILKYAKYAENLPSDLIIFRDGFWVSTTSRFFYIQEFFKIFQIKSAFHIENDVMIYEDLQTLEEELEDEIYMVQDNKTRVIPSIVYIPNLEKLTHLNDHILKSLSQTWMNDMELLGKFKNKKEFPINFKNKSKYIFDGAAIGQFLGGIDPKNLSKEHIVLNEINNPSKGFINETSDFKIQRHMSFFRKSVIIDPKKKGIDLFYGIMEEQDTKHLKQIVNLHIHSKQLYQFSSIFDVTFDNIITGDRILKLADFVISTPDIHMYHKNLESFVDTTKILLVKDFNNVNITAINSYFDSIKTETIKLFIYTHILDDFIELFP